MTARARLLDLAARAEAATGADDDIDRDVALATGWETRESRWSVSPDWRAPGKTWEQSRSDGDYPPAFTASRDAAHILLPKGWGVSIDASSPADGVDARALRYVGAGKVQEVVASASGEHAEARARTAAALRARAEEMTDEAR